MNAIPFNQLVQPVGEKTQRELALCAIYYLEIYSPTDSRTPSAIRRLITSSRVAKISKNYPDLCRKLAQQGLIYVTGDGHWSLTVPDGKEAVKKLIRDISSGDQFLFISGRKCWSDPNRNFPEMTAKLNGELLVIDPYWGEGTLTNLAKIEAGGRQIRMLTNQLSPKEQKNEIGFQKNFRNFQKEFKNIQIKIYPLLNEVHDRYIIGDNGLLIVGHGIKDLGSKESFVIKLERDLIGDEIITDLKKRFEDRWKKAQQYLKS